MLLYILLYIAEREDKLRKSDIEVGHGERCLPAQANDSSGYTPWSLIAGNFHSHYRALGGGPIYEEMWNEPDLTE